MACLIVWIIFFQENYYVDESQQNVNIVLIDADILLRNVGIALLIITLIGMIGQTI